METRRGVGWLLTGVPKAALLVVALLFSLPGLSAAAPVIVQTTPADVTCVAAIGCEEGIFTGSGDVARDLFRAGELLLSGVAASALHASETIAAVPLPAAGWLLLAGMGGLGLFGRIRSLPSLRRHRGGVEPAATALRGSAHAAVRAGHRAPAIFHLSGAGQSRALLVIARRAGDDLRAFAPGQSSPVRPCGGAAARWAATAERAPPAVAAVERAAGVLPRAVRHGRIRDLPEFSTRLLGRLFGRMACFLCVFRPETGVFFAPAPFVMCRVNNDKNGVNPPSSSWPALTRGGPHISIYE